MNNYSPPQKAAIALSKREIGVTPTELNKKLKTPKSPIGPRVRTLKALEKRGVIENRGGRFHYCREKNEKAAAAAPNGRKNGATFPRPATDVKATTVEMSIPNSGASRESLANFFESLAVILRS